MKTLWTNEYLSSLADDAEVAISKEVPCIYVRFPLNITLGDAIYDFSSTLITSPAQDITGIIRITWLGWTVHPVSPFQMKNMVVPFAPGSDTIQGRPFIYLRQGYGLSQIKFYPAPNATITYDDSDLNTQDGIRANVIVSGWRVADTSGTAYRIPDAIREQLVRYYVMERAYSREGKGQNLDAAKFYGMLYNNTLKRFKSIVEQLFASRTKFQSPMADRLFGTKPPRPMLPPNFGEPV